MATLIQIILIDGKSVGKQAYERNWEQHLEIMKAPLSRATINDGAFHTFSLNKKGNRAVSKVIWPDDSGFIEILKR